LLLGEVPDIRERHKRKERGMAPAEKHLCLACSAEMELTMIIPPFRTSHGLKIYTCPKCGRSEDYLVVLASKAA
jgi:predicted  nucleic acid-binding Zn-ribbon protein